jgi:hypothetical protein
MMAAPGSGSRPWKLGGVKDITVCMEKGSAKQPSSLGVGHCIPYQTQNKSPSFVSSSPPSACVLCLRMDKSIQDVST